MQLDDFKILQQYFRDTGKKPGNLVSKYEILPRPVLLMAGSRMPLRLRLYRAVRDWLVSLRLIKPSQFDSAWSPRLKHVPAAQGAKVVLFWAVGEFDEHDLRLALTTQLERFKSQGGVLGVLVTNVPDFAFYSRLGWLVEFLPKLPGDREAYVQQKLSYLAWRYRDAAVVPCVMNEKSYES